MDTIAPAPEQETEEEAEERQAEYEQRKEEYDAEQKRKEEERKQDFERQAVAVLQPLFREHPDHPGIAHYMIHACDNPQMAHEGLEAARQYARIAPQVPHALHMPAHVFARLGLWEDDIQSNLASKAAAEAGGLHHGAENRLHAMEFLEYAYLQTGRFNEAKAIARKRRRFNPQMWILDTPICGRLLRRAFQRCWPSKPRIG